MIRTPQAPETPRYGPYRFTPQAPQAPDINYGALAKGALKAGKAGYDFATTGAVNPATIAGLVALGLKLSGDPNASALGSVIGGLTPMIPAATAIGTGAIGGGAAGAGAAAAGLGAGAATGGALALPMIPIIAGSLFGKGGIWGSGRGEQPDPLERHGINTLGKSISEGRTPSLESVRTGDPSQAIRADWKTFSDAVNASQGYNAQDRIANWQDGGRGISEIKDPLARLLNPENLPNYDPLGAGAPEKSGFNSMSDYLLHKARNTYPEWTSSDSYDHGGRVKGQPKTNVRITAQEGEYVVNRKASTLRGELLKAINSGASKTTLAGILKAGK